MKENTVIAVEGVSKCFALQNATSSDGNDNSFWALSNISFEVKKGESVGIIGQNGSGKSTLLKILAGVTKPTSGTVKVKGKVASILDIGAGFHPDLSGHENIFLIGKIHGFSTKEIEGSYQKIIVFSGIESFIFEPVKHYSNGMFLRLAFSIMAHLDFDVYLFDEVFSVGDAQFEQQSKQKLQQLVASGKTTVFVSHNMAELCNQSLFILLEKGSISRIENSNKLLTEYIESSIRKSGEIVHSSNVLITDFTQFPTSEVVQVKKVEMLQENTTILSTDKNTRIKILFEKANANEPIDVAIVITDIQGGIVLTATSLTTESLSCSKAGLHTYECVFPMNYFGYHAYRLSVLFIKNTQHFYTADSETLSITKQGVSNILNTAFYMQNLITFKMNFKLSGSAVKLETLNLGGGLLPFLDWKLKSHEILQQTHDVLLLNKKLPCN